MMDDPAGLLRQLFDVAVRAADPMSVVPVALPARPVGRVIVIGAGKASARMAEAVEVAWGPCEGLVITRDGHKRPTRAVEVAQASHPVPDQRGLEATGRILDLIADAGSDDLVLALISGGGSALMVRPVAGVSLADKQWVNRALLDCGAPIGEINIVRKHLSGVKGGQLAAAAYPARMLALLISDVPRDDPELIASGPTVAEDSLPSDAAAILERWGIRPPASVSAALSAPSGVVPPLDPRLARCETRIIAAPSQSLAAAASMAESRGIQVRQIGDAIEGEARLVAEGQAALARSIRAGMSPGDAPVLILSGGECTVIRRGDGIGGPNAEFALALALALDAAPGIHAIACDTDGIDGAAAVAGAIIGPDTLAKAATAGLDLRDSLARNDAHTAFARIGGGVVSGPTLTNVNDFRAILILPPDRAAP